MNPIRHEDLLRQGNYSPVSIGGRTPAVLLDLHRFMLRLRRCEEALIDEYHKADEMRCPVHFCLGQEAAPAALSVLIRPEDYLFSHHRSHGYYLAKGAALNGLFAELFGKETGACGGRAGSQDIASAAHRYFGGAILAGGIGCAIGAGLAQQLRHPGAIACAAFGEGATDEGLFWEAIHYAGAARLPVVFLCENNRYATFRQQAADNLCERVRAFGVHADAVFGNDAVAILDVLRAAVDRARHNLGPSFVEAYTHRWCPHVGPESDDAVGYRSAAEVQFWRDHCPLVLLEERLEAAGLLTVETQGRLERAVADEIAAAFDFARSSPWPRRSDWARMNWAAATPLADELLTDMEAGAFDEQQAFAIPGPY